MNSLTSLDRRQLLLAAGAAALGSTVSPLHAQTAWPSKPIRFVVPFAPGGTSEIVARSVAAELTKQLGHNVFVENKPGGAGVVAMIDVAKAAPDGHTLILGHVGTLAVNPYMLANQPYDVNKDFIPVTLLAKVPNVFVVHTDVPARNFKEFVAYVKKNPGQLNYGSAGNASAGHLAMEYLKLVTGMYITHIPYRGTGPQLTDLLAGRTQASSAGLPALSAHIKSGKLRAIAVGTQQRISHLLCAGESLLRPLGQRPQHSRIQPGGYVAVVTARRSRRLRLDALDVLRLRQRRLTLIERQVRLAC